MRRAIDGAYFPRIADRIRAQVARRFKQKSRPSQFYPIVAEPAPLPPVLEGRGADGRVSALPTRPVKTKRFSMNKKGLVTAIVLSVLAIIFIGMSVLYSQKVDEDAAASGTTAKQQVPNSRVNEQPASEARTPPRPPLQDTNVPPAGGRR